MRLDLRMLALLTLVLAGCTDRSGQRITHIPAPAQSEVDAQGLRNRARADRAAEAQWRALDANSRADVQAAALAFAQLDAAAQARLRAEFDALDDVTRRGYLLGPTLGQAWPHLQPVFGYVPESERAPLLAMLRGMDRDQLFQLQRVAWRTPVEARAPLRQRLLTMSADARRAWLFEQNY